MARRSQEPRSSPAAAARESTASLTLTDGSTVKVPVSRFLGGRGLSPSERKAHAELGRKLAQQTLAANADRLSAYQVRGDVGFRRDEPVLELETGVQVGAFPLRSPTTGRDEIPVVIKPRFGWGGLSSLLGGCGFTAMPALMPLPMLPRSEREVPPWVLSSVVLERIGRLLRDMQRRFTFVESELSQPRGTLRLDRWATQNLAQGRATRIPCRFPDLRDDEEVLSALHWTLLRQRGSLESQRSHGLAVRRLLDDCATLLVSVRGVPPRRPAPRLLASDGRRSPLLRAALDAVGWTVDERGLAGLADLGGLPWRLSMEAAFEAWVEAAARQLSRSRAATVLAGRAGETRSAIRWEAGASMGSLVPDVVVQAGNTLLVVDAKYKDHWGALAERGWQSASAAVRETHRADLHQVLAYASTFRARRVVACLAYPLRLVPEGGERLLRRGRLAERPEVELALVGMPIAGERLSAATRALGELLDRPLE